MKCDSEIIKLKLKQSYKSVFIISNFLPKGTLGPRVAVFSKSWIPTQSQKGDPINQIK